MSSLTGRVFGNYEIYESVGRGGMSTVYRGLDRRSKYEVAIKFISPALAENEQFFRRFRREVKVVAGLDHPNIVPVIDYGEQDGYAYQVMPFLRIGSLTARLEKGALSLETGGRLLDQVASALAFAHQHGVIHRDVKPSNILLDPEGNALLADFGMARHVEGSDSLTGSAVVGTPAYMAPEQIQGGPVDGRCDQYALGIILFQLATGSLPFEADTPMGYLLKHVNEPLPIPRQRNAQVPETIEQVILKATAKDPRERFSSVSEMNNALQAGLAFLQDPAANQAPTIDLPSHQGSTVILSQPKPPRKTLRVAAAIAGVLFFLLAVPVFASGIVDLLERASSPAEGSLIGPMVEVTAQMATIEALSTELAGSMVASGNNIELAVVQTLAAGGFEATGKGGDEVESSETPPVGQTQIASEASALEVSEDSPTPSPTAPSQATQAPGRTSTTIAASSEPTASSTSVPATPKASDTSPPQPTSTPLPPQPTATEVACALISLGGFNVNEDSAFWTVTNDGSATVTISRIVLDWPAGNGTLDRIRFDNSSIWNGDDETPPSDISSGWTGNRVLVSGASKELKFDFTSQAQEGGYELQLSVIGDC